MPNSEESLGPSRDDAANRGRLKTYAEKILEAVTLLNEAAHATKKGTSFQAIKKYLNFYDYSVDYSIKAAMKKCINSGALVHTKGTGLNGSFKLGAGKPVNQRKVLQVKNPEAANGNGNSSKSRIILPGKPKVASGGALRKFAENSKWNNLVRNENAGAG